MFKIEGERSPMFEISLVKIETDQEHQARVQQRYEEARARMGATWPCDRANFVARKDGKQ